MQTIAVPRHLPSEEMLIILAEMAFEEAHTADPIQRHVLETFGINATQELVNRGRKAVVVGMAQGQLALEVIG